MFTKCTATPISWIETYIENIRRNKLKYGRYEETDLIIQSGVVQHLLQQGVNLVDR